MKKTKMWVTAFVPSILMAGFAGYIIMTKGYVNGSGWLIFGSIALYPNIKSR